MTKASAIIHLASHYCHALPHPPILCARPSSSTSSSSRRLYIAVSLSNSGRTWQCSGRRRRPAAGNHSDPHQPATDPAGTGTHCTPDAAHSAWTAWFEKRARAQPCWRWYVRVCLLCGRGFVGQWGVVTTGDGKLQEIVKAVVTDSRQKLRCAKILVLRMCKRCKLWAKQLNKVQCCPKTLG